MKTTLSALFAVAAAMLFAGCAAVDPVDTPPAPQPQNATPAPAAKPVESATEKPVPKAAPAPGIAEKRAIEFQGPERNPVVVLCGCATGEPAKTVCRGVIDRLVAAGYVDAARPLPEGCAYATLYRFPCDPKLDIPGNAAKLHEFLSGLRTELQKKYTEKFKRPGYEVHFDLFAYGACGLLARYYLRYGEQPLPANGISLPLLDWRGAKLMDKLILVGAPNDGSLAILSEIVSAARPDPATAGTPFVTSPAAYQMLPGVNAGTVHYADAPDGPALDLLNPAVWTANRWGLADPAVRAAIGEKEAADRLDNCLRRAKQFRSAMEIPSQPPKNVALFLFAGNSVPTASRLLVDRKTGRLSVAEYVPGDGRTTLASARFDRRGNDNGLPFSQSPIFWQSVSHLPGEYRELLSSDRLWDDIRYDLLMFPTDRQREVFHLNRK